jgi:hypothetical protein
MCYLSSAWSSVALMDLLPYSVSGCIIPCMLCDQTTSGLNLLLCYNNTYLVIGVDCLGPIQPAQ